MPKATAKPIAKTAAKPELPKRNDGIHPPIVESEGIVGEPLRLGKGRGGDEVRGCALRATSTPQRRQYTRNEPSRFLAPQASPLAHDPLGPPIIHTRSTSAPIATSFAGFRSVLLSKEELT
jgi:hypothetical protein